MGKRDRGIRHLSSTNLRPQRPSRRLTHFCLAPTCLLSLPALPPSLATLHLEGCPLPGSRDKPRALPPTLLALAPANALQDLQLPTGEHVGVFFGEPLQELLLATGDAPEPVPEPEPVSSVAQASTQCHTESSALEL